MPPEALPEPWHSFLQELDGSLEQDFSLHCMGGFVVTLVYDFARPTSDIDVLSGISLDDQFRKLVELGGKGSALHKKYGIYLDCVTVTTVPENYEDRLAEMFPGTFPHLRLFALDPYDLALSKLERNIQRDRDDVKHLARKVPFDLAILKERYDRELRPYLGNPNREDTTLKLWIEMIEEGRRADEP
jgi:hypothetical protein